MPIYKVDFSGQSSVYYRPWERQFSLYLNILVITYASSFPSSSKISTIAQEISSASVTCTDTEKSSLTTQVTSMETAITLVFRWKEAIKAKAAEPDSAWEDHAADTQDDLDRLLDAFTAEPLAEAKREVHAIDSTVVQLWEDVLSDDASHDLVFECEHGKCVGAHALVVACACRYVWSLEGLGSTGSLARRRRPCLVPQQQLRRPLC